MGALVLDVERADVERRELQNGADAAALAIAEDCARGDCGDEDATAEIFADANARDDASNVDDVDVDLDDREVTVSTSTATEDGDEVAFGFAQIFGLDGATVSAEATAAWGTPQTVDAVPITISYEEYLAGKGDDLVMLCFKQNSNPRCADGLGGLMDGPGSFGYTEGADCEAINPQGKPVEVMDKAVDVDHGNDGPKNLGCVAASDFQPDPTTGEARVIFLPVHDALNGGQYRIVGFAAIAVSAFKFTGNKDEWCWIPSEVATDLAVDCGGNERWLSGRFVDFVVHDAQLAKHPNAEFAGVAAVQLTK
jgi:hypothetical protein